MIDKNKYSMLLNKLKLVNDAIIRYNLIDNSTIDINSKRMDRGLELAEEQTYILKGISEIENSNNLLFLKRIENV